MAKGTWQGNNYVVSGGVAGRVVYYSKRPGIGAEWWVQGQGWKIKVFSDKTPIAEIKQAVESKVNSLASAKDSRSARLHRALDAVLDRS